MKRAGVASVGLALALTLGCGVAQAKDPTCDGRWMNPITDICWKCLFPLSIGKTELAKGDLPDTSNPSSPIQFCPAPPPLLVRPGIAIGFWEPFAISDVTRAPGCMVNMGGFSIPIPKVGTGAGTKAANNNPGTFYHVHWYKYPLISWLNIITSVGCMQGGEYDIAYMSELDPMWKDDSLALFISPEAILMVRKLNRPLLGFLTMNCGRKESHMVLAVAE